MKEKTCAFTGHRPQKLPFGFNEADERCTALKKLLRTKIIEYIETEHVTHFISGMALGTDMYAAEIVLGLKAAYPGITLTCALPCESQASGRSLCATGIMQCFPNATVRFCCKPDTHQTAWRNATATWSTTQTFSSPYGTAAPAEPGKPSNTRSSRESMS